MSRQVSKNFEACVKNTKVSVKKFRGKCQKYRGKWCFLVKAITFHRSDLTRYIKKEKWSSDHELQLSFFTYLVKSLLWKVMLKTRKHQTPRYFLTLTSKIIDTYLENFWHSPRNFWHLPRNFWHLPRYFWHSPRKFLTLTSKIFAPPLYWGWRRNFFPIWNGRRMRFFWAFFKIFF